MQCKESGKTNPTTKAQPAESVSEVDVGVAERAIEVIPAIPSVRPPSESDAEQPKDPKCNLQTVLKPGIPGSPGNLIPSERNPNGDSEMSALMRKMFEDLQETRQILLNGEVPETFPSGHERMRCTWPTEPNSRNEIFDSMAQIYLNNLKRFVKADSGQAKHFNSVVDACVMCHENSCRGPIPLIETLRLPAAAP